MMSSKNRRDSRTAWSSSTTATLRLSISANLGSLQINANKDIRNAPDGFRIDMDQRRLRSLTAPDLNRLDRLRLNANSSSRPAPDVVMHLLQKATAFGPVAGR